MTPIASYQCFLLISYAGCKVSPRFRQSWPISVNKCWRQQKLCWFWKFCGIILKLYTVDGVNHALYRLDYSTKSKSQKLTIYRTQNRPTQTPESTSLRNPPYHTLSSFVLTPSHYVTPQKVIIIFPTRWFCPIFYLIFIKDRHKNWKK